MSMQEIDWECRSHTLLAVNLGASLIDAGIETINVARTLAQTRPFALIAIGAVDICYAG